MSNYERTIEYGKDNTFLKAILYNGDVIIPVINDTDYKGLAFTKYNGVKLVKENPDQIQARDLEEKNHAKLKSYDTVRISL